MSFAAADRGKKRGRRDSFTKPPSTSPKGGTPHKPAMAFSARFGFSIRLSNRIANMSASKS